jgi:proline dehydrogenase
LPVKGLIKYTIFRTVLWRRDHCRLRTVIRALHQYGVGTILDYSVEGEKTEAGFEITTREIIATIGKAAGNPAIPFSVFKITGVADTALLGKVQAGEPLSPAEKAAFEKVKTRVDAIVPGGLCPPGAGVIDGEETWIQGAIDSLRTK